MKEIFDQAGEETEVQSREAKHINTTLLLLSIATLLFTFGKVWYAKLYPPSPWIPAYTPFYINGTLLNYSIIQFVGFIPALLLRIRKWYIVSTICVLWFMVLAFIFRFNFEMWRLFVYFE